MIDNKLFDEMGKLWSRLRNGGLSDPVSLMRDAHELNGKLPEYYAKLNQVMTEFTAQGGQLPPEEAKSVARKICRFCAAMMWTLRRFGFYSNEYYLLGAGMGAAYFTLGRYERAAYRFKRTMPLLRQRMPPGHEFYLAMECVWAREQLRQEKDAELLPDLERVISKARDAGCTSRYLQNLETLRNSIYGHTGLTDIAESLFQKSLEDCIRRSGPESREVIDLMCQQAQTVELPKRNVTRANDLLSRCLHILDAKGASWISPTRMNVELLAAEIEQLAGNNENAIHHLKVADQEARCSFPSRDPAIIEITLRLAERLEQAGRAHEAMESLNTLANSLEEAGWLPPAQRARFSVIHLGCLLASGGLSGWSSSTSTPPYLKLDSLKQHYTYFLQNFKEEIRRRRSWSGEDVQVNNSQEIWGLIGLNILLLLIGEKPQFEEIESAFLQVVEFKGRITESMCISREHRLAVLYPKARGQLERLAKIRKRLQELDGGVHSKDAPELLNEKRRIEEHLADQIPELSWRALEIEDLAADLEDLHEDCALLDFVHVGPTEDLAFSSFAVFILPSGCSGQLRMIGLKGSEAIAATVQEFREATSSGSDYNRPLEELWTRVWKPVEAELEELRRSMPGRSLKRLFISPDHCLSCLPLQVLRAPEWPPDKFLIDQYEISYLSTSRDIVNIPDLRAQLGARPLSIGLNEFDAGYAGRTNSGSRTFRSLHNAEDQARDVGRWLNAETWTGVDQVTRENLLKKLGHVHNKQARDENYRSPAVIHVMLHGFSFNKNGSAAISHFQSKVHAADMEEALRRSGLALSGAEASINALLSLDPLPPSLPGIVSAHEISGLDLRDTQLVVLAACKSGLGTLSSGEGVFGLQRSFIVAGAHSLIMALWNMNESAAAQLMEAFYASLCRGESRSHALLAAQQQIRKKFSHPAHWGGFICQGNPLSISQIVPQECSSESSSLG